MPRATTSQRVVRITRAPAGRLLSSRHHASESDKLTIGGLGARIAKAKHVFLAAAYYDIEFCNALLAHAPRDAKSIRLLFNGLGGSRLLVQREELSQLEKTLRKRIPGTEVRLAFAPGIFHSKLLVIDHGRKRTALIGSANATMAAMTINEEILVELADHADIESYSDRIWASATPLGELDDRLKAKSLVAFFRTGSLYFKPTTSLQTTLNPFTELLGALTNEERRKLGAASLPHSDQESGVGAFNLRRAAGFSDNARDTEDREATKASIKPYAVETCFGYWVPRAVDGQLQTMLQQVAASKQARLLELRRVLETTGTKALASRYSEYVSAVRRLLLDSGVSFSAFLAKARRDPFDPAQFDTFLERVLARLRNEQYLDRLCKPFVPGAMPELWDDPIAYRDFESSFFEYLEYVAQQPGKKSRVPKRILDRCGFSASSPDAIAIKSALQKLLATKHWAEEDW